MTDKIRTEAIHQTADEIYIILEGAARFMNAAEAQILCDKIQKLLVSEFGPIMHELCKACGDPRSMHNNPDGMGCYGIASYDAETNGYERCHCREFIPK